MGHGTLFLNNETPGKTEPRLCIHLQNRKEMRINICCMLLIMNVLELARDLKANIVELTSAEVLHCP